MKKIIFILTITLCLFLTSCLDFANDYTDLNNEGYEFAEFYNRQIALESYYIRDDGWVELVNVGGTKYLVDRSSVMLKKGKWNE